MIKSKTKRGDDRIGSKVRFFRVMILWLCLFELHVYSQTSLLTLDFQTPTQLDTFHIALDSTPGLLCTDLPVEVDDYNVNIVSDPLNPSNRVFQIIANVDLDSGLRVPVIAFLNIPGGFVDGRVYTITGKFRMASPLPDTGKSLEHLDLNISLLIDGREYFFELFWTLNMWDGKYGKVWTRDTLPPDSLDTNFSCDDSLFVKCLMDLPDDDQWHDFLLEVEYNGEEKIARRLSVDDTEVELNMSLGSTPKPPEWEDHFHILLETHNVNTNCLTDRAFQGTSQWDDLMISVQDITGINKDGIRTIEGIGPVFFDYTTRSFVARLSNELINSTNSEKAAISARLINIQGKIVHQFLSPQWNSETKSLIWGFSPEGRPVSSGLHLFKIQIDEDFITKKVLID